MAGLSGQAKAELNQNLARRLQALGGDVGEVEAITADDRSLFILLDALVQVQERHAKALAQGK